MENGKVLLIGVAAFAAGIILNKLLNKPKNLNVWQLEEGAGVRWGKKGLLETYTGSPETAMNLFLKGKQMANEVEVRAMEYDYELAKKLGVDAAKSDTSKYSFIQVKNIPYNTVTGILIDNQNGTVEAKSMRLLA